MSINWTSLPLLDAPRRRARLAAFGDRQKLARAKRKRAKEPKNHATNKERAILAKKKASDAERARLLRDAVRQIRKLAVRAYYAGEGEPPP